MFRNNIRNISKFKKTNEQEHRGWDDMNMKHIIMEEPLREMFQTFFNSPEIANLVDYLRGW